jgi:nitrogen fixation/metabolism regulation signal transduction histidine kinase
MTSDALQSSARFESVYTWLLIVNVLALLALFMLVGLNLRQLISQVRHRRVGSRLTLRIVSLLIVLSIMPVGIVYYFALEFINQRLDSWFNVEVEQGMEAALAMSKASIGALVRESSRQMEGAARELSLMEEEISALHLDEWREQMGAYELNLLTNNGKVLIASIADTNQLLPSRPNDNILLHMQNKSHYAGFEGFSSQMSTTTNLPHESTDDALATETMSVINSTDSFRIRVVSRLHRPSLHRAEQTYLLHGVFTFSSRINELGQTLTQVFEAYRKRAFLHDPLKLSFTLVLSLVLLLGIFSAIWMAFFSTRRLVAPLSELVEGTRAVAHGDYNKQLPVHHFDELGFLVQSFNDMTRRIARARDDVWHSQRVAESQRLYLETVLARLSSGVISLDTRYCLRTANPAACHILGLPLEKALDQPLSGLVQEYPELQPLEQLLSENCQQQREDWREEITVFGNSGRKVLMCRGTHLQGHQEHETEAGNYDMLITSGYVVVFDDITTLIQAQRDAAWSEVARRMAHEIKNPLTPIQLSAERLRHKYLNKLEEADASTLDRLTYTIIQQVEAMKEMVNAFSDYAKTPTIQKQPLQLKTLIQEVLDLYQHKQLTLVYEAEAELPLIAADAAKLRQILHNLIKNAMEATLESGQDAVHLCFQLHHLTQTSFECIELRIYDQGPGIPTELLDKLFEPYVTTKTKGTGLGLAIVKKIVEEHGGIIWLENLAEGGACAVIRLPTIHQSNNSPLTPTVETT